MVVYSAVRKHHGIYYMWATRILSIAAEVSGVTCYLLGYASHTDWYMAFTLFIFTLKSVKSIQGGFTRVGEGVCPANISAIHP